MPNVFLVSDTHFGHEKTCSVFKREDGSPLRPFANAAEMDEVMVQRWNETVNPHDKVYHLGDVAMGKKALPIMSRLNGDKVLIRGNHDIFDVNVYTPYFRDVRGCHMLDGMFLSHVPIHPESLHRFGTNIHGHLHANRVKKMRGIDVATGEILYSNENDPRYHSVCVELTDFRPISFDDVRQRIRTEGGIVGFNPKKDGPSM